MLSRIMKPLAYHVLRLLADGEFHSGATLAQTTGMSRASVWNAVQEIEAVGLDVFSVRGRGYRLARPVSMLDAVRIAHWLGEATPFSLEIVDEADSTNTLLLQRAQAGAPHASVIAVEWQRAGRGRLNRPWHAAVGGALTFSVLWRFSQGATTLAGLSLAVGLAVVRALETFGPGKLSGVGLKWPNDVLWRGRKIAGILIEMQGDALGPSAVVIGAGINVRLSPALDARIDQAAADLETMLGTSGGQVTGGAQVVDRNQLLAVLLGEFNRVLLEFERAGFQPFREDWQRRHVHQGCAVRLALPGGVSESGVARGVGADGALLLETARGVRPFHSGDVSLRAAGRAS
jgi:BirA family biotin operon repressor/biotin-[acetyl-CoA-carboxylase] ligase